MFKLVSRFIIMLLLSFSFSVANAAWVVDMTVEGVQSTAGGGFIVYGPPNTGTSCPEGGKLFYARNGYNGQTNDGIKTTLSIVLLAFAAGKTITFAYDETDPACHINTVLVNP